MTVLLKNTISCSDQHVMENRSNPNTLTVTYDIWTVAAAFKRECVCLSVCFNQQAAEVEITGFRDLTGRKKM